MPNPWDVPMFPDAGDESEDTLFASVGRALTGWEQFEQALARLFATLVGSRSYAAIRAYGSVIAFRGRSEMVKAAASAYFHENPNRLSQKRLSDLLNLAGRYSARRNEIAHGLLTPLATAMQNPMRKGYVLCPPDYATNKTEMMSLTAGMPVGRSLRWMAPGYAYSSVEIDTFGQRFRDLISVTMPIREILSGQP
jgi:hypothetical protein